MHIVKPFQIGVIARPLGDPRGHRLAVGALMAAPIDAPDAPLDERKIWPLSQALPEGGPKALDEGFPKARAEAMVVGSAHPPPDDAWAVRSEARMRIADIDKRVLVFGARTWRRTPLGLSVPGEAKPLAPTDLSYASAFGGPADPVNPIGIGLDAKGRPHGPMPLLERPGRPLLSPSNRPPPAALGAIDIAWSPRAEKAGTYDLAWARTRFPGLPDDHDPTLRNVTAPDQWAGRPFEPGEPYRLEGMHPTRPVIEGRLPPLRARSALLFGDGPHDPHGPFAEIEMTLDTVVFLPDREMVLIVFHGIAPVGDSDAADVSGLLLAYEDARDVPRPADHYEAALRARLSPEGRTRLALDWSPLRPAKDAATLEREAAEDAGALAAAEARLAEIAAAQEDRARARMGQAPRTEPPPAPTIDPATFVSPRARAATEIDIGAMIDRLDSEAARARAEAERAEAEMRRARDALAADLKRDDLAVVAAALDAAELALPDPRAAAADTTRAAAIRGEAAARLPRQLSRRALKPNAAPSAALRSALRERVRTWLADGVSLAGRDLAGADLSGLDLSKRDLSGTLLERADLRGADLSSAILRGAVLTEAILDDARFTAAVLDAANLGGASASRTDFTDATLNGAATDALSAPAARFDRATLTDGSWTKLTLAGASLAGAALRQVALVDADLSGVDASGATFALGVAHNCRLDGAVFERARFERFALSECDGRGVSFAGADIRGLRVAGRNALPAVVLDRASGSGSGWSGAELPDASALGTDLAGADLSRTVLAGGDFRGASLRRTLFGGADLARCRFAGADLMDANLRKASFDDTDLRGANLVGATLLEVDLTKTDLSRARFDPQQAAVLEIGT